MAVAGGVVVVRSAAGKAHLAQLGGLLHDRAAGALLGPLREEDRAHREQSQDEQRERERALWAPQPDRHEVRGVAGERLQDRGGLARGLAAARSLDRQDLLEVM